MAIYLIVLLYVSMALFGKRTPIPFTILLVTAVAIVSLTSSIGFQPLRPQQAFASSQSIINSQQSSDQSQTVTDSSGSTDKQIAIDNVSNTNTGTISVNHKIVQTQTVANSPGSTNIQIANNSRGNFVSGGGGSTPQQTITGNQLISQNSWLTIQPTLRITKIC